MKLSVIIPTRNRCVLLGETLDSIKNQSLSTESFEVIVVDNGSTDDTKRVVESYMGSLTNLRYEFVSEPGLHEGRHGGLAASRGDILIYIDDDIEAFPKWLETYADVFSDQSVVMAGGNNIPKFLEEPPQWLLALWEQSLSNEGRILSTLSLLERFGDRREFSPHLVWGCNFAIRKSILLECGGFHPDGVPKELIRYRGDGETSVSQYIVDQGLKCVFDPEASVYHKVTAGRMTHTYFRDRGYAQGISDSYTTFRNGGKLVRNDSLFTRILRRLKKMLLDKLFLPKESQDALRMFSLGYRAGYNFHQKCFREDKSVRDWVVKEKYY